MIYPAIAAWRQNRQIVSRLLRTVFARRIFGHLCQARASLCALVIHTRRWLENSPDEMMSHGCDRHGARTLSPLLSPLMTNTTRDKKHMAKTADYKNIPLHQMPGTFIQISNKSVISNLLSDYRKITSLLKEILTIFFIVEISSSKFHRQKAEISLPFLKEII